MAREQCCHYADDDKAYECVQIYSSEELSIVPGRVVKVSLLGFRKSPSLNHENLTVKSLQIMIDALQSAELLSPVSLQECSQYSPAESDTMIGLGTVCVCSTLL